MLFTCVPAIWQHVPESNQNCSDNYKTKQPLTNTISPDPISDPIGAVLDYFGLLSLDISIAGCVGDVPAAALSMQATAHTRLVVERTSTSAISSSNLTIDNATKHNLRPERFPQPKHTSKSAQKQRACNQLHTQQLTQFDLGENRERVYAAASIDNAEPDRKLDQTNQIQRLDETETQTQTTHDRTTQDLTAPRVRTADESQIQVDAETVKLLQASIVEPKIHFFPSDCYAAEFDPACIELLPNFRDPIKISDQITCQESKYSLCDFDAGPPLKSGSSVSIQFREILNGGIVWTYWFFSPLSL